MAYVPHIISGKLSRKLDQASTLESKLLWMPRGASDIGAAQLCGAAGPVASWWTFRFQRRRPIGQGTMSYLEVVPGEDCATGDELVLR